MKKYRVAVIGVAQMHITTIAQSFTKSNRVEWVGCSDLPLPFETIADKPSSKKHLIPQLMQENNIPRFFADWRDLLAEKPDILLLATENTRHAEVAVEALNRGIHVLIEKPFAACYEDAKAMVDAADKSGATLFINWPTGWDPAIRTALRLVREGIIGRPIKFHYRNMESLGPFSYGQGLTPEEMAAEWWYHGEFGGGALLDYICYGCNLSRLFLGKKAQSAVALAKNLVSDFAPVEDHVAATLDFGDSIAVLEGTWATFASGCVDTGPVIFGDKGTIVANRLAPEVRIYTERHIKEPSRIVPADPLPEGREDIAPEFFRTIETGLPPFEAFEAHINLEAMSALDAVRRAAGSGKIEELK